MLRGILTVTVFTRKLDTLCLSLTSHRSIIIHLVQSQSYLLKPYNYTVENISCLSLTSHRTKSIIIHLVQSQSYLLKSYNYTVENTSCLSLTSHRSIITVRFIAANVQHIERVIVFSFLGAHGFTALDLLSMRNLRLSIATPTISFQFLGPLISMVLCKLVHFLTMFMTVYNFTSLMLL